MGPPPCWRSGWRRSAAGAAARYGCVSPVVPYPPLPAAEYSSPATCLPFLLRPFLLPARGTRIV
jgi:hypothetical protein